MSLARAALAMLLLGLAGAGGPARAAAGSWVGEAAPVRVAVPGRAHASEAMMPPAGQGEGAPPRRIVWRYRADQPVRARLCQGPHCQALSGLRGRLQRPAGFRADRPLRLEFQLPAGQHRAVRVTDIQIIVDY